MSTAIKTNRIFVPAKDILLLILQYLQFPDAKICVHSVAADLLSKLEEHGMKPDKNFEIAAKSIINANDETAIAAIEKILKNI